MRLTHILLVAAAFALTACSSEDPVEESSTTQQTLLSYAKCMRDNGVALPDPTEGDPGSMYEGIDQDSPSFTAAHETCGPILEGVVEERQQQNGEDQAQQHEELLALAKCLREHGIDVPDPTPGAEEPFSDSLDRTDPATAQAIKDCNA